MKMPQVLVDTNKITSAIESFRKIIKEQFTGPLRSYRTFPQGERVYVEEYWADTKYGKLTIALPLEDWNTRVPHLITLGSFDATAPDVELNIPLGLDRRVSGVYVKNNEDIWLCSRGKFTSYRSAIKKDLTLSHFAKWLITVQDVDRDTEVIPVGAISSPYIVNQISEFVQHVKKLKQIHKNGIDITEVTDNKWRETREFEGDIDRQNKSSHITYEYLHGPICNTLTEYLKNSKESNNRQYSVKSNRKIDAALVNNKEKAVVIFEVKTSTSFSEQLYKGIGQLFAYRAEYGNEATSLFMILPEDSVDSFKKIEPILGTMGIYLYIAKEDSFVNLKGEPLYKLVHKLITLGEFDE